MEEKRKEAALSMVRAVYEEGVATINERDYKFHKMTHKKRLKVFGFFTANQEKLLSNNWSFLATSEWDQVTKVIEDTVTYNDSALSKLPTHWDKYPEDYLTFVGTALGVISFPFMRGAQ